MSENKNTNELLQNEQQQNKINRYNSEVLRCFLSH